MKPKEKYEAEKCHCPYCEKELKMSCFEPVFCNPCNIKLIKCKKCSELFNDRLKKCPKCEGIK
jgi:RNA polymerase subunit RPABC4/transcription elongation factor Spt4